jgi:hypothetical protein
MLKTLLATFILLAVSAGIAAAQATVVDSKGNRVGAYYPLPLPYNPHFELPLINTDTQDVALVNVPIAEKSDLLFLLPFDPGFAPVGLPGAALTFLVLLYYTSSNCSGQPYMPPLTYGRTAVVNTYEVADGKLYFGTPGEAKAITPGSSNAVGSTGALSACQDLGPPALPQKMRLSPTETIDLTSLGFVPPFHLSE